jgi:hypothetical protein
MNPRPSNDDESKMRGHLGTELGNKVTDTLVSIKKKDNNGRVLFTVKQMDARGKDLDDWQFEVTDAACALGVPRIVGNIVGIDRQQREDVEGDDPEDIKNFISEFPFSYIKDGQSFTLPDNTIYTKTPVVDTSTNVYYLVDNTELAITNIRFSFTDWFDSNGIISADANGITIDFEH